MGSETTISKPKTKSVGGQKQIFQYCPDTPSPVADTAIDWPRLQRIKADLYHKDEVSYADALWMVQTLEKFGKA